MDCSDAWDKIKGLSKNEFKIKIESQSLPKDRQDILFEFVQGKVSHSRENDIKAFVLKAINPDCYNAIAHKESPYSSGELYEYDPPKNGQNIIKHGIGFNDVVSFSEGSFGTVIVPIGKDKEERLVIFSSFAPKSYRLEIPPSGIKWINYSISIATLSKQKFRLISARLLSSRRIKYKKTISQAIGGIIVDKRERQGFINRCVEILERDLIKNGHPNAAHSKSSTD